MRSSSSTDDGKSSRLSGSRKPGKSAKFKMQVEVIDRFPSSLDDVARRSPQATFYHTSVWIESLIHAYPSMRFRCIVAQSEGDIIGYLPFFVTRRGMAVWSLPFGTYGGPVLIDGSAAQALVDKFVAIRGAAGVYEIGLVDFSNAVTPPSLDTETAITHVIELTPEFADVWTGRFEKSKRRQTRKAQREGIDVVETSSTDQLRRYYKIYAQRTRAWKQRLRYPESLFTELFKRGDGSVRLFVALADDRLLGGHLNFYFKDTVIAWNGVTTEDSKGVQASTLLYASCIRHACENGFRHYNLGGSLGKESLVQYKESLGGLPYQYQVLRWRSLGARIASAVRRYLPKR